MDTPTVTVDCDACGKPIVRLTVAVRARDGFQQLQVRTTPSAARMRREFRQREEAGNPPSLQQRDGMIAVDDHLVILPTGERRYRLWCEGSKGRPHQVRRSTPVQPAVVLERRLQAAYDAALAAGRKRVSVRELR